MLTPPLQHRHVTPHRRHLLAVGIALTATTFFKPTKAPAQETPHGKTDHQLPGHLMTARLRAGASEAISLSRWGSSQPGGVTVVGVHAFGDYKMGFAETAKLLTSRGHTVTAYDQPGFGATPARGIYASDDAYRKHLTKVIRFARSQSPRRPVVVMGESFGASVAISAVGRGDIVVDGLILSGPGVRENLPAKGFWDGLISSVADVFGPRSVRLTQENPRMSDVAQARFASDPMVVRDVRADTYERVVALADLASVEASSIQVPTLVLYGGDDGIIARASIDALMARLGRHGHLKVYQDRPHLVLQARERTDIDRDITAFLDQIDAR